MSYKIGDFQEDNFEQKLLGLKDTQDSIQNLSSWCLKYQQQHKKVVACWLHVLRKVKVEQRVTLFYLANDVIQYSKRRNYPFVESWATALQKATPLVRDDKVKHKILRLFRIWGERNVYDETFLSDLSGLLTAHTKKSTVSTADLIQDFQPTFLFSKIRKCKLLEDDTDTKLKLVKQSSLPIYDDIDGVLAAVKDRQNCDDFLMDVDDGIIRLEAYTKALELEIKERIEVINVLEISEHFYETQRGEAKVVCNAYRNFGSRIKALKKKLEELLPTLPSPVPSPDINAPSPSSGSDLDIPDESFFNPEKSYMPNNSASLVNLTSDEQSEYIRLLQQQNYEPQDQYKAQSLQDSFDQYVPKETRSSLGYYKGNPIEVIDSSQTDGRDFNGDNDSRSFLQNVITNPPPAVNLSHSRIPGLESPTDNTRNIFNFIESKGKPKNAETLAWIEKPVTKYQSWPSPDLLWNNSQETPVSPPAFEQESYSNPVEYVDTNADNRFSSAFKDSHQVADVDHRIFNINSKNLISNNNYDQLSTLLPKRDDDRSFSQNSVANHNLIALTNSPSVNDVWKLSDSDYRTIPMPPTPPVTLDVADKSGRISKPPIDNIESVDMEMSDEEEGKHEDRNRHRKLSLKDDEEENKKDHSTQLLPPPNPWDMVNVSHLENDDDNVSDARRNGTSFNKMMLPNFMENMMNSSPSVPLSNFPQFPVPPARDVPPGPGSRLMNPPLLSGPNRPLNPMSFPQPPIMNMPPQDSNVFLPRMNYPNPMPGPNYSQQFNNFMAYNKPPNRPPLFQPPTDHISGNALMNPPPAMNSSFQNTYSKSAYQPVEDGSSLYSKSSGKEESYTRNSVSNIEPIIKNRQFDNRTCEAGSAFESFDNTLNANQSKLGSRSNLLEISLSNVLEKSLLENEQTEKENSNDARNTRNNNETSVIDANDFLGDENVTSDNIGDDGDDLYNNIEETFDQSNDNPFVINDMSCVPATPIADVNHKKQPRTPFQGTVPKVAKLPMTPACTVESDDRSQWEIAPIIDLSDDNNMYELHTMPHSQQNEMVNEMKNQISNTPFFRRGGSNVDSRPRFGRGSPRFPNSNNDRHFQGSVQTPMRRGRFPHSRNDFRSRGPNIFNSPNQEQMRNVRPMFNRSPGDVNLRNNFQNSPGRIYSGRPQRPFRRGW